MSQPLFVTDWPAAPVRLLTRKVTRLQAAAVVSRVIRTEMDQPNRSIHAPH